MGLAASQARYLTLTSRKNDLEFQSQTINSRRIQLSYKTAEIARAYSEAMNNKKIQICIPSITDPDKNVWEALTFSNLLSNGFVLIGSHGAKLDPSPYLIEAETKSVHHRQSDDTQVGETGKSIREYTITKADFDALDPDYLQELFVTAVDGKTDTYKLKNTIDAATFAKLDGGKSNTTVAMYLSCYNATPEEEVTTSLKTNPNYNNSEGTPAQNIQTLLTSGKAQIVTKEFFDYLVQQGCYTYSDGIQGGGSFEALLDAYNVATNNVQAIYDWRSDETSNFKQKTYTEDDEKAIAEYEAATAEVQAQDKILEMEEKQIETQHKAIETELESVKKVLQKNIDDTFKIFS